MDMFERESSCESEETDPPIALSCSLEVGRAAWWFVAAITSNGRFHVLRMGEDYWLLDSLHGHKRRLEFEWAGVRSERDDLPPSMFAHTRVFNLRFVSADRLIALLRDARRCFAVLMTVSVREGRLKALDVLKLPAESFVLKTAEEKNAVGCFHFKKNPKLYDGSLITMNGDRLEVGRRVDLLAALPLEFRTIANRKAFGFEGDREQKTLNPRKLFEFSLRSGRTTTHSIQVDTSMVRWIERASKCTWIGSLFVVVVEEAEDDGRFLLFTFDLRTRRWEQRADVRIRGALVQTIAASDHSLVLRSREEVGGRVVNHFFRLFLRNPPALLEAAWSIARSSAALARLPVDSKLRCPWGQKRSNEAEHPELPPIGAKRSKIQRY